MLGNPHETLHRMFREGSTLFAHASQFAFGERLYDKFEVSEENTDLTEYEPVERRVDTLLRLTHDGDEHLAIVEARLGATRTSARAGRTTSPICTTSTAAR